MSWPIKQTTLEEGQTSLRFGQTSLSTLSKGVLVVVDGLLALEVEGVVYPLGLDVDDDRYVISLPESEAA